MHRVCCIYQWYDTSTLCQKVAAQLRDLFEKSPRETGIPTELANSIIDLFNDEYDNLFLNNDIYFAVFALDPRKLKLSLITRVCSFGG